MAKRVAVYGTWDALHAGHLRLLRRAIKCGDYLIVGVSTDQFNREKGKKALLPYRLRKEIIQSLPGVDRVIPEKSWEQKAHDILKYDIDLLVFGDDWKGQFDNLLCDVKYFPRTKGISTTEIKKWMK